MRISNEILKSERFKRILLCRTDKLGDVILALPCAVLLKRMFPDCQVSFLVQATTAPVVRIFDVVDQVLDFDAKMSVPVVTDVLRSGRFDTAVALYPEFRLARALHKSDIKLRAGIAFRWYSPLFNYRHKEHRKHNLKHELEYNLSLTFSTFCSNGTWENYLRVADVFPLDFKIPDETINKVSTIITAVKDVPRKVIVIHPGGGGSAHRWPTALFAEFARRLVKELSVLLLVTGVEKEKQLCDEVCLAAEGNCLNLCTELSLIELAELYRHCDLVVTNSTGPLHLGRAVGASVLGLYPSTHGMSPVRWGPYGQPDRALTSPQGGSMKDLSVQSVYERSLKLLEETS